MYRLKEIQKGLRNLVGWEQAYDPAKRIDEELTKSESGITYQGAHPLMTLDNIASIIPQDFELQYAVWDINAAYRKGDKVLHGGALWCAMQDNAATEPESGAVWQKCSVVSAYLERLVDNGIASVVQNFITDKQLSRETRSLLERRTFFDGAGRLAATIENRSNLVGFEIVPVRSMGVTTHIDRIGLQMTGGTGVVRMYVFHSSQVEPIDTFDLEYTKTNGGFMWFDVDLYLPYISDGNNSGGAWFICYNQDELPDGMRAINVSKDWSREPCGTCNIGSIEQWRELTKYLQVSPFARKAPTTFAEFPEMWDITENRYTNTLNYGLNAEVSVGCDLTDFIIRQRSIFANVLQKQVAVNALRTMAMNPDVRVNRNQSNVSRMDVLYEIDGNTEGRPSGLGYELKQAYKALNIDTDGIDRICLACQNGGVRYRVV